jgi:DNA-binding response OmpR family regulator
MKSAIKVLIVDDDKSSGQMLSEVVKRAGFRPVVSTKPDDALNIAKLQTVHAAIIDVMLPKKNGVELSVELRGTRFSDNPIILISGVFKDKNFANESLSKTNAVDFLFKPFGADDITKALKAALGNQMGDSGWSVKSLLGRQFKTNRDRSKAIERLDKIRGSEFPFILTFLMEAEISGHLNIVLDSGEIYGVTLSKGTLAQLDSLEAQSIGVLALIQKGFLSQQDWETFQNSAAKRIALDRLVEEQLVSPHGVSVARHEQIINDFKAICSAENLQVNFVPQEAPDEEPPKHAVTLRELLRLVASSLSDLFPHEYLVDFYSDVSKIPLVLMRPGEDLEPFWAAKGAAPLTGMKKAVTSRGTLEQALTEHPDNQQQIYSFIHYLVLSRTVMFSDQEKQKDSKAIEENYRNLFAQLEHKTADEVFKYFGAKDGLSRSAAEKIAAEFINANKTSQLPKDASKELIELCKKCVDLVIAAREIVLDPVRREALIQSQKQMVEERHKKSNELLNVGLDQLRKGQFERALATLRLAEENHSTSHVALIRIWAEVKSGIFATNRAGLHERLKQLEGYVPDDRRSGFYYMAVGVVKKALGDATAQNAFERVLQMDPQFTEARRELNSLVAAPESAKEKKMDLLTGDITEIVSSLIRRKAK